MVDVGGVLFVPDHECVTAALDGAGVAIGPDEMRQAHYAGMRAADLLSPERGQPGMAYLTGVARSLGIPEPLAPTVLRPLVELWQGPASELWRVPVPGSAGALRMLAASGFGVAVVSNSDGTVEAKLRDTGTCQVGMGTGVEVAVVVDSGAFGVSKPDPAIFAPALAALGADPASTWYVGDSVRYDVAGAVAAGMTPVHVDPLELCDGEHVHVAGLHEVASQLVA